MPHPLRAAARHWRLLAAASITALALAVPTTASANTLTSKTSFTGSGANAAWQTVDGCLQTDTGVTAADGKIKDLLTGHTSTSSVVVYSFKYDFCQAPGGVLVALYFTSVDLAPDQFSTSGGGSTAVLKASVPAVEQVSGATVNLTLDLSWKATAAPFTSKTTTTYVLPDGTRIRDVFSGSSAAATTTGTVSDGSTNLALSPAESAGIQTTQNRTLMLSKP